MPTFLCVAVSLTLMSAAGVRQNINLLELTKDPSATTVDCKDEVKQVLDKTQWTKAMQNRWASSAGKVKVFEGSEAKWVDMVPDSKHWSEGHSFERKRMVNIGRQADEEEETKVRGFCDMSIISMKYFSHSPKFLDAVKEMLPATCQDVSVKVLSEHIMDAMQEKCLGSCVSALHSYMEEVDQSCELDGLTREFYTHIVDSNAQCAATPVDTLEWISTMTLYQRCRTFMPKSKSYVWSINDKGPDDYAEGSTDAACQLPADKQDGSKYDIVVKGMCPEGSKCKCPMTSLKSRDTSRAIRFKGQQALFSMTGNAALPSVAKQYTTSFVIATVMATVTAEGLAVTAAAIATLEAPTFLLTGTLMLSIKAAWNFFTFHCKDTIGCWPQRPDNVKLSDTPKACRMPEKTAQGGSPVWYMPPPLMKMAHHRGSCILKACDKSEIWSEKIGFGADEDYAEGKPHVFNCQPVTWEEMQPDVRKVFVQRLEAGGVSSEYELPEAEKWY